MARPSILATEFRSWLAVALWVVILLLTIPFARAFQVIIRDTLGDDSFGYFVIAVVVISVLYLILKLRPATAELRAANVGWLLLCGAFIIAYTFRLWGNPVEAVHFIQYGVLAALLFNAFLWRHKKSQKEICITNNIFKQLELWKRFLPVFATLFFTTWLINLDIILIKHYFNPALAGEYAALAVVGHIIFFIDRKSVV